MVLSASVAGAAFVPDFKIGPDDYTVLMVADGNNPEGLKPWISDHRKLQVKNWPLGGITTWQVEETVREYIAFEFLSDVADDIANVVATLEKNHHMRWWPGELEGVKLDLNWFPSRGVKPQADPCAEEAYATVQRVDAKLTAQARQSWRWRQLYLRALLDSELKTNGGKPNDRCYEVFAELIKLYHAQNANPAVRPPLPAGYKPQRLNRDD